MDGILYKSAGKYQTTSYGRGSQMYVGFMFLVDGTRDSQHITETKLDTPVPETKLKIY